MSNFKPTQEVKQVPFFEDVDSSEGWEGHRTRKTMRQLQAEISANLSLIGCGLTGFREGTFGDRYGFQIFFSMQAEDGRMIPSRMEIAALPLRSKSKTHVEDTKRMALYMTAKAIKGMYFLNVLSSAYIPFMSLMLNSKNQTLGEVWIQQGALQALLPPPSEDFSPEVVEGIVEAG